MRRRWQKLNRWNRETKHAQDKLFNVEAQLKIFSFVSKKRTK